MGTLKHYLKLIFKFAPKLAATFSGGSIMRTVVLTFTFWYFLISRKTFYRGKVKVFIFIYMGRQFNLELASAIDIAVLSEIFVLKEYAWEPKHEINSILDLGAHWGDSALYYTLKYPNAKIYAVEPTPSEFERLKKISETFTNIYPIQGALSDTGEDADLYITKSSLGNSLIRRSHNDEKIIVKTLTFKRLCDLADIEQFDLVKFDIEGAEKIIFSDTGSLNFAKAFIGEIHYDLMSLNKIDIANFFAGWTTQETLINSVRSIISAELT